MAFLTSAQIAERASKAPRLYKNTVDVSTFMKQPVLNKPAVASTPLRQIQEYQATSTDPMTLALAEFNALSPELQQIRLAEMQAALDAEAAMREPVITDALQNV